MWSYGSLDRPGGFIAIQALAPWCAFDAASPPVFSVAFQIVHILGLAEILPTRSNLEACYVKEGLDIRNGCVNMCDMGFSGRKKKEKRDDSFSRTRRTGPWARGVEERRAGGGSYRMLSRAERRTGDHSPTVACARA